MLIAGGAATLPVLLRGTVDDLLGRGVGVHGGHQAFVDAEAFLEEDVDDRGEAVGGAARVGDDVVLGGIVGVVVHALDDGGDVVALARCGEDHLLGALVEVALGSRLPR
jgi:hypothetical protein